MVIQTSAYSRFLLLQEQSSFQALLLWPLFFACWSDQLLLVSEENPSQIKYVKDSYNSYFQLPADHRMIFFIEGFFSLQIWDIYIYISIWKEHIFIDLYLNSETKTHITTKFYLAHKIGLGGFLLLLLKLEKQKQLYFLSFCFQDASLVFKYSVLINQTLLTRN